MTTYTIFVDTKNLSLQIKSEMPSHESLHLVFTLLLKALIAFVSVAVGPGVVVFSPPCCLL